jgi:hypothetical protein
MRSSKFGPRRHSSKSTLGKKIVAGLPLGAALMFRASIIARIFRYTNWNPILFWQFQSRLLLAASFRIRIEDSAGLFFQTRFFDLPTALTTLG